MFFTAAHEATFLTGLRHLGSHTCSHGAMKASTYHLHMLYAQYRLLVTNMQREKKDSDKNVPGNHRCVQHTCNARPVYASRHRTCATRPDTRPLNRKNARRRTRRTPRQASDDPCARPNRGQQPNTAPGALSKRQPGCTPPVPRALHSAGAPAREQGSQSTPQSRSATSELIEAPSLRGCPAHMPTWWGLCTSRDMRRLWAGG